MCYQSSRWKWQQAVFPVKFPPPPPYPHPLHPHESPPVCMTHQMDVSRYTIGRSAINGKEFRTLVHHGTCEIFGENLDSVWNITRILLYGICLVPMKFPQDSPSQKVLVLIYPA